MGLLEVLSNFNIIPWTIAILLFVGIVAIFSRKTANNILDTLDCSEPAPGEIEHDPYWKINRDESKPFVFDPRQRR